MAMLLAPALIVICSSVLRRAVAGSPMAMNQDITIGINQTENVGARRTTTIGSTDSLTVGATRTASIGGADSLSVGGAISVSAGGGITLTAGAAIIRYLKCRHRYYGAGDYTEWQTGSTSALADIT
jgi:hypothetical protein